MQLIELPAMRKNKIGGILGDIDSHLPAGHQYKDSDRVTWAHETIHGIHARIRNENQSANGYYLLDDKAILFVASGITLRELAEKIPQRDRGRLYQLYLVDQQRWWNDEAFYCLDELIAYMHGAAAGAELGMARRFCESLKNTYEMLGYANRLIDLAAEKKYSQFDDLKFLLNRVERMCLVLDKSHQNLHYRGK